MGALQLGENLRNYLWPHLGQTKSCRQLFVFSGDSQSEAFDFGGSWVRASLHRKPQRVTMPQWVLQWYRILNNHGSRSLVIYQRESFGWTRQLISTSIERRLGEWNLYLNSEKTCKTETVSSNFKTSLLRHMLKTLASMCHKRFSFSSPRFDLSTPTDTTLSTTPHQQTM